MTREQRTIQRAFIAGAAVPVITLLLIQSGMNGWLIAGVMFAAITALGNPVARWIRG